MMEQAADTLREHHATGHTSGGFQGAAEEAAAGCRSGLLRIVRRWRAEVLLGCRRAVILLRCRFAPAASRGRRGTLSRRRTRAATKNARQETTAAARRRCGTLRLGRLQLRLQTLDLLSQLFVLLVEALERSLLHQNRLGHEITCRRLAGQVFLDPRFSLGVARGCLRFGLLQPRKQSIDQGLLFAVHGDLVDCRG
ncbi:hypothetical protein D3C81_1529710 [compost metagenome]